MSSYLFLFEHYEVTDRKVKFYYSYKEGGKKIADFCEIYTLPIAIDLDNKVTIRVLEMLHLIVGVSYYKSLLGDISNPYKVNEDDANYLNTVYDQGLSELAYVNKLTDRIRPFVANSTQKNVVESLTNSGSLLGIGGGKDSIVAGELLRKLNMPTTTMDMATRDNHGQAGAVMDVMGFDQLGVGRYVDTKIIDFTNTRNGNHGHIPFSAILAWVGVLLAVTTNKQYVMVANESSTSTGNTEWNGRIINHQWAKSYEFEKITQTYIHASISSNIWYFSPIRPYSSLAVMALFSQWGKEYYSSFTSCNFVLRIDPSDRPNNRWCGECPKCLSTWLLLSAWLQLEELETIFSKNMFDDVSLRPLLLELLDLEGHKPLNCVGTSEELRAVTRKAMDKYATTPLLAGLSIDEIPGPTIESLVEDIAEHNIPKELAPRILELVSSTLTKY